MGSRSRNSSSGGPRKHGNFKSQERCSCDSSNEKVKKVEWISVPSMSGSASAAISAGRFIVDIIPGINVAAETIVRNQKPTHDAINVYINCSNCNHNCWYTIEYMDCGRRKETGYYHNFDVNHSEDITKDMNMKDLLTIYDNNSDNWTKEKYSLLYHNCKDFAKEKYNEIVENYCNK
jgi:hypothetical protein